jgi:hypothetical protein
VLISIIIPTLNRAAALAATLNSVAACILSASDVEVLVIDNGSTDRTACVCKDIADCHPGICWRYFHEQMPGLLSARHRGAKEARGSILCYLDDDVLLSPSWLEGIRDAFRNPSIVLVGGPCLPKYEIEPPSWLAGLWLELDAGRTLSQLSLVDLGADRKPVDPLLIWGLNFAIRRQTLVECGGFNPDTMPRTLQRYQGDGETGLALKIKEKALGSLYHPAAAVEHVIPGSRLTPEAFENRGFFQGVCDSYTQIRRDGCPATHPKRTWKDALRATKRAVERAMWLRQGPTSKAICSLISRSMVLGWQFHQREVQNDPGLLEWVLRADYFSSCELPAGWHQLHLSAVSR